MFCSKENLDKAQQLSRTLFDIKTRRFQKVQGPTGNFLENFNDYIVSVLKSFSFVTFSIII